MIITLMSYSGWSNHVIQKKSAVLQTTLFHLLQFARQEAIYQNKIMVVYYSASDHCMTVYTQTTLNLGEAANEENLRSPHLVHNGGERMQPAQPKFKLGKIYSENPVTIARILRLPQNNILHSNQPRGFRFHPEGRCLTPGTITITSKSDPHYQRKIIINDSGRPRLST